MLPIETLPTVSGQIDLLLLNDFMKREVCKVKRKLLQINISFHVQSAVYLLSHKRVHIFLSEHFYWNDCAKQCFALKNVLQVYLHASFRCIAGSFVLI